MVDVDGAVIGVKTCVRSEAEGIGFAVPADVVGYVSREIIEHGVVERAALGAAVTRRMVKVEGATRPRITVSRATSTSDLRAGDVILCVKGQEVLVLGDLLRILTRKRIGRPLHIELLRGGRRRKVTVVLGRLAPEQ